MKVIGGVPDDEVNKITYENACRWYSFDPFAALAPVEHGRRTPRRRPGP